MRGMTLAFGTFWIIMIIFSDMNYVGLSDKSTRAMLYIIDRNVERFRDQVKWLEEDLKELEAKEDLTFKKDNANVEE